MGTEGAQAPKKPEDGEDDGDRDDDALKGRGHRDERHNQPGEDADEGDDKQGFDNGHSSGGYRPEAPRVEPIARLAGTVFRHTPKVDVYREQRKRERAQRRRNTRHAKKRTSG